MQIRVLGPKKLLSLLKRMTLPDNCKKHFQIETVPSSNLGLNTTDIMNVCFYLLLFGWNQIKYSDCFSMKDVSVMFVFISRSRNKSN